MNRRRRWGWTAVLILGMVGSTFLPAGSSQALRGRNHEAATTVGLPFLRTRVLEDIVEENRHVDFLAKSLPFDHFNGCDFLGSSREIAWKDSQAVKYLDPRSPDGWTATDQFGFALHIAQDFYAHSNWVNLGRRDLIDSGVGYYPELEPETLVRDDVMILQDDGLHRLGPGIRVLSGGFAPKLQGPDGRVYGGLMSGTGGDVFYNATGRLSKSMCPKGVRMNHHVLNKDDAEDHLFHVARSLAIAQTRQEWCRLLNQLKTAYGWNGVTVPLGLWVRPGEQYGAPGNQCGAVTNTHGVLELGAPIERVRVSVQNMRVLNDRTPRGPGELNFVLGVSDGAFRGSVRSQSGPFRQGPGRVPPSRFPASASLCMDPQRDLVTFLTGWADGERSGRTVGLYDDGRVGETVSIPPHKDQALRAQSYATATPAAAVGTHRLAGGKDLTGTVKVTVVKEDPDRDGASTCMERAVGTDPSVADTDHDGLSDGQELLTVKSNALMPDTDGDRIKDGAEVMLGTDATVGNGHVTPGTDWWTRSGPLYVGGLAVLVTAGIATVLVRRRPRPFRQRP